jgi:tetratricopeptide (TPR) repeat protein
MKKATKRTNNAAKGVRKKMSLSAILLCGVLCAAVALLTLIAVRHIHIRSSPSVANSERLLAQGRPREAMALLNRMPKGKSTADSRKMLHQGRVKFALLVAELREERWGSYGINPDNWISHPLAFEAEQLFLDAMALAPNDPEIRLVLGNLYREQGRFGDAEIILRSVLDLDVRNADAFLTLGLLYMEGGRLPAARRALAEAWELDRGNSQIAKNIAYYYRFYVDMPESSIVWFSRFIDTNPVRDPDINLIRGELRSLLERYPEFEGYRRDPSQLVNRRNTHNIPTPRERRGVVDY